MSYSRLQHLTCRGSGAPFLKITSDTSLGVMYRLYTSNATYDARGEPLEAGR